MAGDRFSVVDYVVFAVMLLISAFIGVWHACRGGKQNTTEEYLLANRKMKFLPVSISILLSFLSAITLLGIPAEIYVYGAQFFMTTIAYLLICIVVSTVFIPMFRRIKLTSVHEVRVFFYFRWGLQRLSCLCPWRPQCRHAIGATSPDIVLTKSQHKLHGSLTYFEIWKNSCIIIFEDYIVQRRLSRHYVWQNIA